MFNDLRNTDAIIFDIRNYPAVSIYNIAYYLFNSPIPIADFTVPDATYPGTLYWYHQYSIAGDYSKTYDKNIFILMDENTQSAAEYMIMGLEQYPKAVKIGSQTAGADGNISIIYLPGGIMTYFTGLGTFYPDHRQTQRIGIVPDLYVYPAVEGIREGKDEVLDAALNYDLTGINNARNNTQLSDYNLEQNYPNPFNPATIISYKLPASAFVVLKVYDVLGREVKTLVNSRQTAGAHSAEFNSVDLPTGVYFYQLRASDASNKEDTFISTKKMLLIK